MSAICTCDQCNDAAGFFGFPIDEEVNHEEGRQEGRRQEDVRTVVWFSAGAASAVAAKLVLAENPDAVVAYTDPGSEHEDNLRFIRDCEEWFSKEVLILRSEKYADTWDVWEKRRFLASPYGALCTTELKKKMRQKFERPNDIHMFGYTAEESHRADRFREQNPEVTLRCPLIERGLSKGDCLALIERAGIELPVMYRLGYQHNNCVGCVKATGAGYWNKIRRDFPDVFERMAKLERELNATVVKVDGERIFLDELDPSRGNHAEEPSFECSLLCDITDQELAA